MAARFQKIGLQLKQNKMKQTINNDKTRGKNLLSAHPPKKKNQQAKKQNHSQSFHLCVNGKGQVYAPTNLKRFLHKIQNLKIQQNNFFRHMIKL